MSNKSEFPEELKPLKPLSKARKSMIVIVCGVSGSGKSSVGARLADSLGVPFYDGDDFHPETNKAKMANGFALNDADRFPWLETLSEKLVCWEANNGAVLACSALSETYREHLVSKCAHPAFWIVLMGSEDLLATRLEGREGHFFDAALLRSQLEAFSPPEYGLHIDVGLPVEEIVDRVAKHIQRRH